LRYLFARACGRERRNLMQSMEPPAKVAGLSATRRWPRQASGPRPPTWRSSQWKVQKAYLGRSNLLSSALAHEMLAYQSEEIYGLGVALAQRDHPKEVSGIRVPMAITNAFFDAFAETGQGLVIMTNGHGGLGLILELEACCGARIQLARRSPAGTRSDKTQSCGASHVHRRVHFQWAISNLR